MLTDGVTLVATEIVIVFDVAVVVVTQDELDVMLTLITSRLANEVLVNVEPV